MPSSVPAHRAVSDCHCAGGYKAVPPAAVPGRKCAPQGSIGRWRPPLGAAEALCSRAKWLLLARVLAGCMDHSPKLPSHLRRELRASRQRALASRMADEALSNPFGAVGKDGHHHLRAAGISLRRAVAIASSRGHPRARSTGRWSGTGDGASAATTSAHLGNAPTLPLPGVRPALLPSMAPLHQSTGEHIILARPRRV